MTWPLVRCLWSVTTHGGSCWRQYQARRGLKASLNLSLPVHSQGQEDQGPNIYPCSTSQQIYGQLYHRS